MGACLLKPVFEGVVDSPFNGSCPSCLFVYRSVNGTFCVYIIVNDKHLGPGHAFKMLHLDFECLDFEIFLFEFFEFYRVVFVKRVIIGNYISLSLSVCISVFVDFSFLHILFMTPCLRVLKL